MRRKTFWLLTSIALLALFALFSKYIKQGRMRDIDFAVTVKIQDRMAKLDTQRLDGLLENVGILASPVFTATAMIVITFLTVIKRKKKRVRLFVLVIPLTFILMTIAEMYGKSVVHHPAPAFFLLKNPTTIFPKYHVWEEYSYPSGHTARATFLAVVFFFLTMEPCFAKASVGRQFSNITKVKKKLWIGLGLGIYIALVSLSRVYLGHHWLSDVIGGGLLGSGISIFVMALL